MRAEKREPNSYSILIMPEGGCKCRKFSLSRSLLKWAGLFAVVWVIFSVAVVCASLYYRDGWLSTADLRKENEEIKLKSAHVEEKLALMEEMVGRAERLAGRLEAVVGIDKKIMSKGIGPISEEDTLPNPKKLSLSKKFDLSTGYGDNPSATFEDLALKLDGLLDTVASVEMRLQEVYEYHSSRLSYWASVPSIWPVRGWVTSEFGVRRSPRGIGTRFHEGIDIAASIGTPVYASADGVVTFAGYKHGLGKTIIIDHGFGITSVYGHNSYLYVREGQKVRRGSSISAVGRTGRTTGPHLHYQVVVDGVPVDPMKYIIENF